MTGNQHLTHSGWKLLEHKIGEDFGPIATLEIGIDNTSIVVLDGQHRANAFRYVSGAFSPQDGTVYSAFYQGIDIPEDFDSDLAVTLIWFEGPEGHVSPTLISRSLFVDVNNSAKKVSLSRTVLLDDSTISALLTQFYYSSVAQNSSFSPAEFSLLHSGFDVDSDLTSSTGHALTLTTPEIVRDIVSWFLFDLGRYDGVGTYRVSNLRRVRNSLMPFERVFSQPEFNRTHVHKHQGSEEIVINSPHQIPNAREAFESAFSPVLHRVFGKFCLFEMHFKACQMTADWVTNQGATINDAWQQVFCGGDGLYYALMEQDIAGGEQMSTHQKAVKEIEDKFRNLRSAQFPEAIKPLVDPAFRTQKTKAFQVAMFMALRMYREQGEELEDTLDEFIERVNDIEAANWIYILTEIKGRVTSGLDPKDWPMFQNLILRCIQENERFYGPMTYKMSPDGRIFQEDLKSRLNAWTESSGEEPDTLSEIDDNLIDEWIEKSLEAASTLFVNAGLTPIIPQNQKALGMKILADELGEEGDTPSATAIDNVEDE